MHGGKDSISVVWGCPELQNFSRPGLNCSPASSSYGVKAVSTQWPISPSVCKIFVLHKATLIIITHLLLAQFTSWWMRWAEEDAVYSSLRSYWVGANFR